MTHKNQPHKHCKECDKILILSNNKITSNVTNSQFKRSNPRCKECMKKRNNTKGIYAKTQEQKINKIKAQKKDLFKVNRNNSRSQGSNLDKKIQQFFTLEPDLVFNAQYIQYKKIHLPLQPTAIQSVMGTGKTTYVEYFMRKALQENKKVLYICPNITTADSTYHNLKSKLPVSHYQLIKEGQEQGREIVVSTVDSCDQWLDYDVLIVDEVLSLFSETTLKTSSSSKSEFANWNAKYKKIMSHKLPVILDRYVSLVIPLFDEKMFTVLNNYKKTKEIYDYQNTKRDEFLDLVIDTAKKTKTAFHTNWISSIKKLEQKAEGLEMKSIHSESVTNLKELQSAQLQASTSKLSRGVDLEAQEVFLQDTGNTHSVITALQMIDRARNSEVINVRISKVDKQRTNTRTYASYNPIDKYEQRLHRFDKMMDLLDSNYKEVLFFMLQDTYNKASVLGMNDLTQTTLDNAINRRINEYAHQGRIQDVFFDDKWVQDVISDLGVTKEQIKRSIELYVLLNKEMLINRIL